LEHFRKRFKKKTGLDVLDDKNAIKKLRIEIEKAKLQLSTDFETEIKIESLIGDNTFSQILTREDFEKLNMKQFNKISEKIKSFRNNSFFDEIILFGGSSKIPRLKKMIQSQYKNIINTQMNADSIAFGASLYSRWQVYGKVMPFSLGKKIANFES
jgi:heat shock protein 5